MSGASRTAILVAGMHRSGTSATAGALAHFGVALGSRMLEPGPDNPRGYWEHERAVEIHEALLAALDRRWDDARPLPSGWQNHPAARQARTDVEALIRTDFRNAPRWGVKDPRICRFLPLWLEAVQQGGARPVVLFVVRHPAEVAASIHKRNGWKPAASVLLWLRHVMDAMRATGGVARTVVTYPDLIADPAATLSTALGRLGVGHAVAQGEALRDFIDPGSRHHTASDDEAASPFMRLALECYRAMVHIAAGSSDWRAAIEVADAFEALWAERAEELDALADMSTTTARRANAVGADLADCKTQLTAQVQWSEEAASKLEAMQAERDGVRSQLIAQIQWSQEAASKLEAVQAERDELRSQLTAQIQWSEAAAAKLEAVQAERDELRSQLTAQIQWSEAAAAKLEAVQAERDELRSQLTAQIQWSEEAAAKLEAVQAERDELRSQLTAQIQWSEEAASRLEVVQAERDELRSQLTAQIRWSEEAASKLEAVQAERDELRSQLTAQTRWAEEAVLVHRAVAAERDELAQHRAALEEVRLRLEAELLASHAHTAALQARADELDRHREAVQADLAASRTQAAELDAALNAIHRSRSWRYTQPFRSLASRLKPHE